MGSRLQVRNTRHKYSVLSLCECGTYRTAAGATSLTHKLYVIMNFNPIDTVLDSEQVHTANVIVKLNPAPLTSSGRGE